MATATRQQQQQRPRGWWFRRRRSSAWLVLVLSGLATIPRLYRTRRWLERTTTTTTPTTTSIGVGVTTSLYNDSSSSSSSQQQQQQQQQQQLLLAQPAQQWALENDLNQTTSVSTIPPQAATASATASFGWETQQSVDHTTRPAALQGAAAVPSPRGGGNSSLSHRRHAPPNDLKTTKSGAPIILPHQQGKQLPSSTNPQQHHYYPRIPNVLLAGVQKAGTTAVSSYLKQQFGGGGGWNKDHRQRHQHPTICFPKPQRGLPHTEKEVHFFDKLYHPNHYDNDNDNDNPQKARAYYAKFYRHCQSTLVAPPPRTTTWQNVTLQARGNSTKTFRGTSIPEQSPLPPHQVPLLMDATPRYFVYPQEIHDFYRRFGLHQTLKIIIILREPMSRELSWYHHLEYLARTRHAPPSFIAPIVRSQSQQRRSLSSQKQPPPPAAKDGTNRSRRSSNSTTTTTRTVGSGGNGGHHRVFTHRRAVSELLTFEEYVNITLLPQLQRSSVVRAVQFNTTTKKTTTTSTDGPRHFGMYAYWLEQWLTLFDRNQIWIANYDQLSSPVFLTQLHAFLELPPPRLGRGSAGARLPPHANAKHVVTTKAITTTQEKDEEEHTRPSCAVQHALFRFFEQHYNPDLYDLLDRFPPVYTAVPAAADRRRRRRVDQHPNNNNNERRAVVETYPFPRFQFTCRVDK
ncbi:hypothetical protein ACA910_010072 [Epithemia clementina (nom. ined.)]